MNFLSTFKKLFSSKPTKEVVTLNKFGLFVYIKIPAPLQPLERGELFEDPLQEALEATGFGEVSGGGSSLSDQKPDGTRAIEWCGIDVEVSDLEKALALIRAELKKLNAPIGTELEYTDCALKLRDILQEDGWVLREPRTSLHPGFGI